jgi:hypothetical protein
MADRQQPPVGEALDWVAKITTVGFEMVLPGVLGHWLGERWGLSFLTFVGIALGFGLGFWHLMLMTKQPRE